MQVELDIASVQEAIAARVPDREALVFRDRRFSYAQWNERTRRLGNHLRRLGLGCHRPRSELAGWESGQDHLALYLYNGNEYLEGMLGAYKARVAPFNVNYRYVDDELVYLLNDARARAILYHAAFAPHVAAVRERVPTLTHFIQVADDSGEALLPDAVDYETALAESTTESHDDVSPDDLYILYTGGTTGMPKGVLWRQSDILFSALGGGAHTSLDGLLEAAVAGGRRILPAAPFMHGAGHWIAFTALNGGHTCVIQDRVERLDPQDIWRVCERERVDFLQIVGDAFGRPLLDELERARAEPAGGYDLSALTILLSGGAPLNAKLKARFLELLPHLNIVDGLGSSETGGQGSHVSTRDTGAATGRFMPGPDNVIVDETLSRVLEPGHEGMGWWAKRGRVPLGYLNDREKTERTFVTIDGGRYAVPGDRARHLPDGTVELHGRDSVTINSGGEKIFAEEVEHALKQHPAVYDAVVTGRPSERWGSEVVAVVQLKEDGAATEQELIESCGAHLARYKLPKAVVFRDRIQRSPSGKADYRWARAQAAAGDAASAAP